MKRKRWMSVVWMTLWVWAVGIGVGQDQRIQDLREIASRLDMTVEYADKMVVNLLCR